MDQYGWNSELPNKFLRKSSISHLYRNFSTVYALLLVHRQTDTNEHFKEYRRTKSHFVAQEFILALKLGACSKVASAWQLLKYIIGIFIQALRFVVFTANIIRTLLLCHSAMKCGRWVPTFRRNILYFEHEEDVLPGRTINKRINKSVTRLRTIIELLLVLIRRFD
jgi:hypothetical protein